MQLFGKGHGDSLTMQEPPAWTSKIPKTNRL
jgi:hypothetical protein